MQTVRSIFTLKCRLSSPSLSPFLANGHSCWSRNLRSIYLSNSTIATTDDQEKSSSKTNSEGTQNAGGSQQSSRGTGKPVRGRPVSWLSFLLLLATGIGIILSLVRQRKETAY